jgi:putative nucleotidyltransferase with HDIG domain
VGSTGGVRRFSKHEIQLSQTLSYQIALAVANARLFRSVQHANTELMRAYDATLEGWSLALEMRDSNTQGHTQRVTEMTVTLARQMGVPEPVLEHVRRGALLHDIGKMGIPDAILHRPGALSEQEAAVMQKHPELAHNFLLHIDFLRPALDIPLCHHERWDGSGYPRGLKGREIPLAARVFAVIDVFDALTSDRSYRRAWTRRKALDYIRQQSGKHFDPDIVEAFLEQMDRA